MVCFFLIIVVLLQSGKSGDIAAAFGGMGSQTAFGPRGAATRTLKATTWSAVLFMVTSITLSIFASRRADGIWVGLVWDETGDQQHRSPLSQRRLRQHRNSGTASARHKVTACLGYFYQAFPREGFSLFRTERAASRTHPSPSFFIRSRVSDTPIRISS